MGGDEPCGTPFLMGQEHPSPSSCLAQCSSCCPNGAPCTGPGRQRGSRLQISRSQAPSLVNMESEKPGGCETSRPLLANTKLIKDSINQPLINNFTRKALVQSCLVFESPCNALPGGLNANTVFQVFYSVLGGVCVVLVCLFVW